MEDSVRLAEVLCARLCHDLAGPAGAVSNGAELLEETDPELAREAAQLMAGAAGQLAKRLRFFRAAFGWEGGATQTLAEAGRIGAEFLAPLEGQPPRFALEGPRGTEPGGEGLRLLLLLLLFGSEALPRGGRIALAASPSEIEILAEGTGASLAGDYAALLTGDLSAAATTPRAAPALLALGLAKRSSWQISAETSPDRVVLRARR